MAEKLKIYACSGVGETKSEQITYDYWLDNINPILNTQAVNSLNVDINLLVTELNYFDLTDQEKIEHLNSIDLYTLCLFYAQEYAKDGDMLDRAGRAIGKLLTKGEFRYKSLNNTDRDAHLDELFTHIASVIKNDDDKVYNADFGVWWAENITARNKYGLTPEQQQIKLEAISGIGAAEDALNDQTIGGYLQNSATFFMYTYFTKEQLRQLPRLFSDKKKYQVRTYNYCLDVFTRLYGSEEKMEEIIRAGIIQRYGADPEVICEDIAKGGNKYSIDGIGVEPATTATMIGAVTVTEFITILTAVLSFIGGLIAAICAYCARVKEAEFAAIDQASIDSGCPNPEDYDGLWGNGGSKLKSILPLAAIVGGVILIANTK